MSFYSHLNNMLIYFILDIFQYPPIINTVIYFEFKLFGFKRL